MKNIIEAIEDKNLFKPFFNNDLETWSNWLTALKTLYGLPVTDETEKTLIQECTGRDSDLLPEDGFSTALLLVGRRSGKSRIAALTAAFEAALSGREKKLAPGEIGIVAVVSPTKFQSRIVRTYIRAAFNSTPILQGEIVDETKEMFKLRNGVEIHTLVADYRSVRGFSLLCAVVDEICFLHLAEENKVRSDTELIQALRPGLSTTQGRLLCIGSPYARRGWAYSTWKRAFGNDKSKTLVWNAPSTLMNSTLSQQVIDDAIEEDPQAARSEYLAEWRDDIAAFVSRELVESLVVTGRKQLAPIQGIKYSAFADVSGGRSDDAALCIAHREGRMIVIDCLEQYESPHNPYEVIAKMAKTIRLYGCDRAIGDAYAAEFSKRAFLSHGIRYNRASTNVWSKNLTAKVAKPKSILYAELLPVMTAGEIELLDNDLLVTQLSSLERRTRSGGRDSIDHPPGQHHDDLSNAVAGAVVCCTQRIIEVGAFRGDQSSELNSFEKRKAALSLVESSVIQSSMQFIAKT